MCHREKERISKAKVLYTMFLLEGIRAAMRDRTDLCLHAKETSHLPFSS